MKVVRCPYIYFHLLEYVSWCSGSIQSPRLDNLPLGSSDVRSSKFNNILLGALLIPI